MARGLAPYAPVWLEEPLPPEDHAGYVALRAEGAVKVATGEHEPDLDGFQDLMRTNAADFIQMDVCCQGGFTMGRRVVEEVRDRSLRFAFQTRGSVGSPELLCS